MAKKKLKDVMEWRSGNYLKKIYLNNFKSFFSDKNIEIKFAPRITLLFGRNSAGKSSIIQALKLMEQSLQKGMDIYLNPPDNDPGGLKFVDYKTIATNGDLSKTITLGLEVIDRYPTAKDKFKFKDDSKSVIKHLSFKNNNLQNCNVDYHSSSEDFNQAEKKNTKFLSLKNEIFKFKGLESYFKSEVSYIGNEYAWKELFKYTLIHKDKILKRLDWSEVFFKKFHKTLSVKDVKKKSYELEKLFKASKEEYGKFDPADFKFHTLKKIQNHKKFLRRMTNPNNIKYFINYISADIRDIKKFLYKNSQLHSYGSIRRNISRKLTDAEDTELFNVSASFASLAQYLCFVVSEICGAERPADFEFDPNDGENKKVLEPGDMVEICRNRVSKVLMETFIFHGQKPLPQKFEPYTGASDFIGYDFAGLPTVIDANQHKINRWFKEFGYDFQVKPETGGPLHDTVILHKKGNHKINYKFGGLGAENVLPVIAQSVASNGKILVFEEPERRAHPRLQIKMADLFVEFSKKNQFIVETHSENLLLGILKNVREGNINAKDVQVSYVYIDKGQSKIDHLELNDDGKFSSNWRDGFFTERLDLL